MPFVLACIAAGKPVLTEKPLGITVPSCELVLDAEIDAGRRFTTVGFMRRYEDVQAVAVCDPFVSKRVRTKAAVDEYYGNTDCKAYEYYGDVLARDDIDAVMISTPDHWHVPMSLAAIRAGKDVCCEKPTYTIEQGQVLVRFHRRAHLHIITASGLLDHPVVVPWWKNMSLRMIAQLP